MLAIYCRKSKAETDEKDTSIPTQKAKGKEFADLNGLDFKYYADKGISGTIADRPEFTKMLQDIKNKEVTAVWVYNQDRIERDPTIWRLFVSTLLNNDCKYYPNGQLFDLNNPENKLLSTIVSAYSELLITNMRLRAKASVQHRAEQNRFRGVPPYGYKYDELNHLIIDEEEAKIVKQIFDLSLSGNGTYTIANILNEKEIPPRYRKYKGEIKRIDSYTKKIKSFEKNAVKWRGNVIYGIITNTIHKGEKMMNGKIYNVPQIIAPELWDKVNQNLQSNKKKVGKKIQYNYLLNGLLVCECGNEMIGMKKKNSDTYRCKNPNCEMKQRGVNIKKIESFIISHLFKNDEVKNILISSKPQNSNLDNLKIKLTQLNKNITKSNKALKNAYKILFQEDFKNDPIILNQISDLKKVVEKTETEKKKIEQRIETESNTSTTKKIEGLINQYNPDLDFDKTKEIVHKLIDNIMVRIFKEDKRLPTYDFIINYNGRLEQFLYQSDYNLLKFRGVEYYRKQAITLKDLEDDKNLILEMGHKIPADFGGLEMGNPLSDIIISNDSLIDFNQLN